MVLCCRGGFVVGWVGFLSGFGSSGALDRGWEPGKVEGLLWKERLACGVWGGGVSRRGGSGGAGKSGLDRLEEPGKIEGLPLRGSERVFEGGVRFLRTQQRVKSQCLIF
jgi:hypothetical protein